MNATPKEQLPVEAGKDEAIDEIFYTLLSELAGVDTHDTSLRDHPEAWKAIARMMASLTAFLATGAQQ